MEKSLNFIDLFAGIGGFHVALKEFGGRCVFASDIDKYASEVYQENHKINPLSDITKIDEKKIPKFDVLCAGFPCQPFSKGGFQNGFEDTRGTLFFDICRIINYHKPKYVLLENVSNLVSHDNGKTYKVICKKLEELGYVIPNSPLILSPHQFCVPVLRPRIYIPAIRKDLTKKEYLDFDSLRLKKCEKKLDIYSVIDKEQKDEKYYISNYEEKVLSLWNEFYKNIDLDVIGFPIWYEEFGKEYDLSHLPEWKQKIITKNRMLYERNKKFIDNWSIKNENLSWVKNSHKKFEWQAGKDQSCIYECLIQFRPSGVRVKRPDKFSTLVAMNHPQIIGKFKRRLTPDESKRLQSLPETFKLHKNTHIALKQLGNGVNVKVLTEIFKILFNHK